MTIVRLKRQLLNVVVMLVSLLTLGSSSALGQSEAAEDQGDNTNEQVTEFTREQKGDQVTIHSSFGSSDIKNWRILDKYHMVIETYRHGDLLATFSHACSGARFADTLGFSTFGPFELDRSTKIILPDGRWCHFKSLVAYESEDKSEDNDGEGQGSEGPDNEDQDNEDQRGESLN